MPVAYPLPQYHWLDENTEVALHLYGDEFLNWFTDDRGNTIISTRNGELHYAKWNNEFHAFEPLEELTATSLSDRSDESKYPDILLPPEYDVRKERIDEYRRHYRNLEHIPDPTKPEVCGSCPTSGVCDPTCESAHVTCSGCCSTCTCCDEPDEEPEIPEPFIVKPVKEGSIIRPILPIYVRFNEDGEGCPHLDLPNYYIDDQITAANKFQTLANYYNKQTQGAVKLVNLGARYVKLDTPPRNYSQHLDEVYDDIIYPALQAVAGERGVNFLKYRRCCDKYRPCRIDPTTCTPLFIVHGYELSEGSVGPGVWGHARWGLGHIKLDGVDFDFDTYMVVGAFQMAYSAPTPMDSTPDVCHCATFIQPGALVHEAGHALFYLQDLYDADGSTAYGLATDETTEYGKADVVLLIDSSGSMPPYMAKVKESISEFATSLTAKGISDWRIGIAQYYKDNYAIHNDTTGSTSDPKWSSTPAGAQTQADALYKSGGAVYQGEAITYALSNYTWRSDAMAKYIILITDAGTGEDGGGPVSISDAADACVAANTTACVICAAANRSQFSDLETKTGGSYAELSDTVSFGDVLATTVADSIRRTIKSNLDDALPGFGMWSPMAYGNWGMHPDAPLVPGEMPTNMDAYSLYQIQPRLTVPQWTDGDKTIQNPYAPHSMVLAGESGELVHETYLLQLRDYEAYDSGLIGYWTVAGQLNMSNPTDTARILPGVLVVHDWGKSKEPIVDAEHMPADIHEAHGVNQNLKCLPMAAIKNYADPEDLFGNDKKAFGDTVADPDDLMVSVREGTVAGFNATNITYVPKSSENSYNSATYNLTIDGPVPVVWNDMSKWPDDLLKPDVSDACSANTWGYFGKHFHCAKGCHTGGKRLFRITNN